MPKFIDIPECIAFHGMSELRQKCVAAVDAEYASGKLETLTGGFKTTSDEEDMSADAQLQDDETTSESRMGIPAQVFYCLDVLCLGMEPKERHFFIKLFLYYLPAGADLSHVWAKLVLWQLGDKRYGLMNQRNINGDDYALERVNALYYNAAFGVSGDAAEWQYLWDHLAIYSQSDVDGVLEGFIIASGFIAPEANETKQAFIRIGILDALSQAASIHTEAINRLSSRMSVIGGTEKALHKMQCSELVDLVRTAPVCTQAQIKQYQKQHSIEIEEAMVA